MAKTLNKKNLANIDGRGKSINIAPHYEFLDMGYLPFGFY